MTESQIEQQDHFNTPIKITLKNIGNRKNMKNVQKAKVNQNFRMSWWTFILVKMPGKTIDLN